MGLPILDYAHPLHTFSTGNLTYTATKECYLCGTIYNKSITINNNKVFQASTVSILVPITKISTGDVVTMGTESALINQDVLKIYEEL